MRLSTAGNIDVLDFRNRSTAGKPSIFDQCAEKRSGGRVSRDPGRDNDPRAALGSGQRENSSANSAYVLTSPRPVSGKRPPFSRRHSHEARRRFGQPLGRLEFIVEATFGDCREAPPSARQSTRPRAAALGAAAISGSRLAKNSCSCSLTRSHGGLPTTQSNPPSAMTSANTSGQWRRRRHRAALSTARVRFGGRQRVQTTPSRRCRSSGTS